MERANFRGLPPEARPQARCARCNDERPCTWACLGTDSILAGSMWVAEELLAEFDRQAAESPAVEFVARGLTASFE